MISQDLLNILACPVCKGGLSPNDAAQTLRCHTCRLDFPVREGIPVMLVEEASHFSGQNTEDNKQ